MSKQKDNKHTQKRLVVGVMIVAVLALVGLGFIVVRGVSNDPTRLNAGQPASVLNLTGKVVCLPHKGDGPHTQECTSGLKVGANAYYALKNIDMSTITTESTITVSGTFYPAPSEQKYDTAGTIAVQSVLKK